jgi:hypothetical protein
VTPEESLDALWDRVIGAWVGDLCRDGLEAAILKPLAQHRSASMHLVDRMRGSDNVAERKIAATIVGFLGVHAPAGLLDELFEAESARDRATQNDGERLETQSVVEDIVFAATRWCRNSERKDAGLAVLRKVVEHTLTGEYWNTSGYAMMGLARHAPAETRDLLVRFTEYANGAQPVHPSKPTMSQEKQFAKAIRDGECDGIEKHLARGEAEAAAVKWDSRSQGAYAAFVAVVQQLP